MKLEQRDDREFANHRDMVEHYRRVRSRLHPPQQRIRRRLPEPPVAVLVEVKPPPPVEAAKPFRPPMAAKLRHEKKIQLAPPVQAWRLPTIPLPQRAMLYRILFQVTHEATGVPPEDVKDDRRFGERVPARRVFCWLAREMLPPGVGATGGKRASWPEIGRHMGDRDHTTIMYNYRKARVQIAEDTGYRESMERLVERANLLAVEAGFPFPMQPRWP